MKVSFGRRQALATKEREAWDAYLEAVSGQPSYRYEEVEPWAWSRLNRKLAEIHAERQLLEDDDGA